MWREYESVQQRGGRVQEEEVVDATPDNQIKSTGAGGGMVLGLDV